MQGTITYGELGIMILFLVILIVGIYAVFALKNLNALLKKADAVVDANQSHLNRIIPHLAEISENTAIASREIRSHMDEIGKSVETITHGTADTVMKVNETADRMAAYAMLVGEVAKVLADLFRNNRKGD